MSRPMGHRGRTITVGVPIAIVDTAGVPVAVVGTAGVPKAIVGAAGISMAIVVISGVPNAIMGAAGIPTTPPDPTPTSPTTSAMAGPIQDKAPPLVTSKTTTHSTLITRIQS
ncbi:hypothetical protein E2C01_012471 [Portunus trituberculatus]|uniref:Uncharacterized protein n=1 Tax=Portunus trituberculatus TaxID=210409 RepID=A0A5B7DE75_PORTR|nr:hypothetical protein [Portunus trituberculatus]